MIAFLPILLLVGGAVTVLAVAFSGSNEPAPPIPLLGSPDSGGSGILPVDVELSSLARIIASEAGSGSLGEQRAIGWTARNRFRNKSIYAVEYPWRAQKGNNPPFSSAKFPSEAHYELAQQILMADQSADPTGGATSFFEPRMQDVFYKAGEMARHGETGDRIIDGVKLTDITRFKSYKKTAADIRMNWSGGSTLYATAGRFEFWGSTPLFAKRGGTVKTIVGWADPKNAYGDIPDVLDLLRRRRRG